MLVRVLEDKCRSGGTCVKICPEIFRLTKGRKKAEVVLDRVPPHLESCCLKAVDSCPNNAIAVFTD